MIAYICQTTSLQLMNRSILLLIFVISSFFTSCIPHKDIVYMQNKNAATMDTLQLMVEQQKPYRVQINDILSVRVKALDQESVRIFNPIGDEILTANSSEQAYFDGFTVDLHGNIRIPTLGNINVLGYTTEEIQTIIENKLLEDQFKETSNIFVTVKLSGLRYSATGEVGNPGTKTLFQERVNIYEALANVGDIPVTGNRKDVLIIRQYPQGQQIHHLDLTDVNVMNSPYYYIQPNDMIYVKPLKQKTWGTGTTGRETLTTIVSIVSLLSTTILLSTRL